jgi:general secretion pathway protein F
MHRFRYLAFTADGTTESGIHQASSEAEAISRLEGLGFTVVELHDDTADGPAFVSARRPSMAVQADLAEQLHVLFDASTPAMKVAEVVATSASDSSVRRHFQRVAQLLADGENFGDAMEKASGALSPLFAVLCQVGQRTGKPVVQMPFLAAAMRRQEKISSQIAGALVYPAILLAGAFGILVLMSLFLAPRLETIFTSIERPVPASIAVFVTLGRFLSSWGFVAAPGIFALLWWSIRLIRKPGRPAREWMQRLPLIGPVLKEAALVRLLRSVQLMLEAGMPLAAAFRETARCFANEPQSAIFRNTAVALEEGRRATTVISSDPEIPTILRELFAIGEESNTLPRILNSVAVSLEDRVERRIQRMMLLLTPVLTLLVGGIIAVIVSSVMGAVLSVNDLAL